MTVFRKLLMGAALGAAVLTATGASAADLLTNGGFEVGAPGIDNYFYPGAGSTVGGWTYNGGVAIANGTGSSWGSAPGANGSAFVALQAGGAISQNFGGAGSGSQDLYLYWKDAGRSTFGGNQTYSVGIDGASAGNYSTVTGQAYGLQSLSLTVDTSVAHSLSFTGLSAGDNTSFLDNVILSTTPRPVVSLSALGDPSALPPGQTLVADFNQQVQGPNAGAAYPTLTPGFTITLDGATVGYNEGAGSYSASLAGDATQYLTISAGMSATFESPVLLSEFSLYVGSPDAFNSIRFLGPDYDWTLTGADMTFGDTNQSWEWGRRISFNFLGARVSKIIFSSSGNSFESDNWAASPASFIPEIPGIPGGETVGAVPEPATWAMMILGFASVGSMIRRRRMSMAAA